MDSRNERELLTLSATLSLDDTSLSIAQFLHRNNHIHLFHSSYFQCGHTDKQMHFHLHQWFTPKSKAPEYHPPLTPPFQVLFHRAPPGLLSNFILRAEYNREELWGPSALPKKAAILQLLSMEPFQFLQSPRQAQLHSTELQQDIDTFSQL